ncbi:putative bactericidal permeability-increasing protein, partial [Apostichopus japonicus]
ADESGHLKIDIADKHCHYHVEESDIELSGGKEWLYNLFEDKIEEMLKKVANEQICDLSSNAIRKDLASALSTVEVIIPLIPDVMSLDLSLTANPASTESFLDILHSGEIFDVNSRSKPSQDKPAFPSDSEDSQMFYIWLTDYGLNSAGQTLFSSGYLHYSLTQKELPENNTLQLNTSGYEISLLLPQISKSYPNKEIQFKIYPSSPPSVQLTEEAVELQVQINIELHIIQDDSTTDNVATLQTTLQLAGSLGLEDSRFIWSVSSFSSQSKLLEADVEDLDMDIINSALSFASHAFIKQYIKDKGSEGIPLPELGNGLEIVHPTIEHGEGFVKIGIDLAR